MGLPSVQQDEERRGRTQSLLVSIVVFVWSEDGGQERSFISQLAKAKSRAEPFDFTQDGTILAV